MQDLKKYLDFLNQSLSTMDKATDCIEGMTDKLRKANAECSFAKSTVIEQTEFLKLPDLKSLIQARQPEGCNGVVCAKYETSNEIHLYVTFAKDGTVLDNSKNLLIIIRTEGISKEIKSLFGDNNLILLT